ncbi:MAG: CARDB domain-containing protein, partial [Methanobacteriota archaeon]
MRRPAPRDAKALSLLIVWTMAFGGLLAALGAFAPVARAGACDQVGGVITGDWTITTAQVCTGIVYTVDGTINVNAGGSLTLINGGLRFAKDTSHQSHALNVNGGGTLVLDNSVVTTQTNAIGPFLILALSVNSAAGSPATFVMRNGASLKFPGWFNATGVAGAQAVLNITDSIVTGFASGEISSLGLDVDANNDAPVMRWSQTQAALYRSRVENLFEHAAGALDLQLVSSTSLSAYDTYIGVDYSDTFSGHNEMTLDGSSSAYLYNVTIDSAESASIPPSSWQPAFRPSAGGNVYLHRWLHASVTNSVGGPINGATVWSRLSPSATTAEYPDNGMASVPSSRTLWYLGRTASGATQWNRTDAGGQAQIPLYTDRIDSASLPNAESFGNYDVTASYGTATVTSGVSFPAYPSLTAADNERVATLSFGAVTCSSGITTWNFSRTITGSVASIAGSLEISGEIAIVDGGIYVEQDQNACGSVRVLAGGSLMLSNSTVWSNYPLVVDVVNGGELTVERGSQLLLTQRFTAGLLRSVGATASVVVRDSVIDANVWVGGGSAWFVRDTFRGPSVSIDTDEAAHVWDANLAGVSSIALLTDDGNPATLDIDVRNTTFDATLSPQLVFTGQQYAQLTSVLVDDPTATWWTWMITENAWVARYVWLTVRAVDGTGTLLADANVTIDLDRLDPATLQPVNLPNPAVDDIYFAATNVWPVQAPEGLILYRAFWESRTVTTRVVDNAYIADGSAFLDLTIYDADAPAQGSVTADVAFSLNFSSLTPDLVVEEIRFSGGNGPLDSQPINSDITITAVIRNTGQINVPNVVVSFFSDDVDRNLDGVLDFPANDFRASVGVGDATITVPKNGTATASVLWHPLGSVESSRTVSVVVDPPPGAVTDGGLIRETAEMNNILARPIILFTWPDLSVGTADVAFTTDPVVNNDVSVRVTIQNEGTNRATGAVVQIFEGVSPLTSPVTVDVSNGASVSVSLVWRPTAVRLYSLDVRVSARADSIRNTDFKTSNNLATVPKTVLTQPDLELRDTDYPSTITTTQGLRFSVILRVHNVGQTPAQNVSVAVYLDSTRSVELGRATGLSVANFTDVSILLNGINIAGVRDLFVAADPENALIEGGAAAENNNFANLTVDVQPPQGSLSINQPQNGTEIQPGVTFIVSGVVRDRNFVGIQGVSLEVLVEGPTGSPVATTTTTSGVGGAWSTSFAVTDAWADGSYRVVVSAPGGLITSTSATFAVERQLPFLLQPFPFLGIPWWLFLVVLAAAVGIVMGATLYFKFYGLGKMVECGECGAFIPEDSTSCPKCNVEFEKDMAKCSNCQAWIPVDVKRCPECGVEFATGEVEMADYQEKMRLQYDEVVHKFKDEAQRQLGRSLSDREFQEWWRKQPTFVTFEDWLREEEEMRKMGSKPCPVCGTLNSV